MMRDRTASQPLATKTATTRTVTCAARYSIRSSATAPSSTSPREPWSTIRPSPRPNVSSSAPRRRGSQSPTTRPNAKSTWWLPDLLADSLAALFADAFCRAVAMLGALGEPTAKFRTEPLSTFHVKPIVRKVWRWRTWAADASRNEKYSAYSPQFEITWRLGTRSD